MEKSWQVGETDRLRDSDANGLRCERELLAYLAQGVVDERSRVWQTRRSNLVAVLITNLTTSNQYATSFIVGEAFKKKYDQMGVARRVLSRSIEDAGTMMENLAPWTPSGIFMAGALGVTSLEYAPWQFMSLANIVIAFFFAATGIAVFSNPKNSNNEEETS